jgi:hypothetical protein
MSFFDPELARSSPTNRGAEALAFLRVDTRDRFHAMDSLVRKDTLQSAAVAAAISTLVCYPRLALWSERPNALWFLGVMLLLVSFLLWSFVFAWYPQHLRRPVIQSQPAVSTWALAVMGGAVGGLLLLFAVDPTLRNVRPTDYPTTLAAWIFATLFNLGFSQLFLCYAPMAFFLRLFRQPAVAVGLTVLFGLGLLAAQLDVVGFELEPRFVLGLYLLRALFGGIAALLFLRGGLLPAATWTLLLECRLLPGLIVA